jgi:hypothetical protein
MKCGEATSGGRPVFGKALVDKDWIPRLLRE